jgi:hypothetical protein
VVFFFFFFFFFSFNHISLIIHILHLPPECLMMLENNLMISMPSENFNEFSLYEVAKGRKIFIN